MAMTKRLSERSITKPWAKNESGMLANAFFAPSRVIFNIVGRYVVGSLPEFVATKRLPAWSKASPRGRERAVATVLRSPWRVYLWIEPRPFPERLSIDVNRSPGSPLAASVAIARTRTWNIAEESLLVGLIVR